MTTTPVAQEGLRPRLATALLEITAAEPQAGSRWVLKTILVLLAVCSCGLSSRDSTLLR